MSPTCTVLETFLNQVPSTQINKTMTCTYKLYSHNVYRLARFGTPPVSKQGFLGGGVSTIKPPPGGVGGGPRKTVVSDGVRDVITTGGALMVVMGLMVTMVMMTVMMLMQLDGAIAIA